MSRELNLIKRIKDEYFYIDLTKLLKTLLIASNKSCEIYGITYERMCELAEIPKNISYGRVRIYSWILEQNLIQIQTVDHQEIYKIVDKEKLVEFIEELEELEEEKLISSIQNCNIIHKGIERKDLRPYQKDIIEQVSKTNKNTIVEAPTGSGKTIIAYHIAKNEISNNGKVLFIAPKIVLIEQTMSVFNSLNPELLHHSSKKRNKKTNMYISTLQTMSFKNMPQDITLLIIDEAHYGHSGHMQTIIRNNHNGRTIALSATPYDFEGNVLDGYDIHINKYNLKYMTENNYLVPLSTYKILDVDLNGISLIRGDYNLKELSERFNILKEIRKVVVNTIPFIKNRKKTIVFAINIEHCELLAQMYREYGITSKSLHSKLPASTQKRRLLLYKNKHIDVLVSVEQLTTGFDDPETDTIVLARATKSFNLYQQIVGRGLRTFINKEDALLLDCANVIESLGLPYDRNIIQKNMLLPIVENLFKNDKVEDIVQVSSTSKTKKQGIIQTGEKEKISRTNSIEERAGLNIDLKKLSLITILNQDQKNDEYSKNFKGDKLRLIWENNVLDNDSYKKEFENSSSESITPMQIRVTEKETPSFFTKNKQKFFERLIENEDKLLKKDLEDNYKHEYENSTLEKTVYQTKSFKEAINTKQTDGKSVEFIQAKNNETIITDDKKYSLNDNSQDEAFKYITTTYKKQDEANRLKVRDFLYKEYEGHCQICGDTFSDGNQNVFKMTSLNIGENRDINRKGNSLSLCHKHYEIFIRKLQNNLYFEKIKDHQKINLFYLSTQFKKYDWVGKLDQEGIEDSFYRLNDNDEFMRDDVYFLPIRLFNEEKYIKFTTAHILEFIAVWNNN